MGPHPSATPGAEPGSLWGEGLLDFSVNSATPASERHKKIMLMGPASFLHHLQLLGTFLRLWGLRCSEVAALIHAPPITSGGSITFLSPLLGKLHFLVLRQPQLPVPYSSPCSPSPTAAPYRNPPRLAPKGGRDRKEPEQGKTHAKVQGWQLNLLQFTVPPQNKELGPIRPHSTSHEQPRPPWGPPAAGAFWRRRWEFGHEHQQDGWTDGRTDGQISTSTARAAQKAELSDWFSISSPGRVGLGELKLSEVNKWSPLALPRPGFPFGTGRVACAASKTVETMRVNHGAGLVPAPGLSVATACRPRSPSVPQFPWDKAAPAPSL